MEFQRFPAPNRSTFGKTAPPALWRHALLLLVALALAWQGFVAGTHIHPLREAISPAASSAVHQAKADPGKSDHKVPDAQDCPLCQAIALGGAYVVAAPADVALPPVIAPAILRFTGALWLPPDGLSSHAWHSRAPPHSN